MICVSCVSVFVVRLSMKLALVAEMVSVPVEVSLIQSSTSAMALIAAVLPVPPKRKEIPCKTETEPA